MIYQLKIPDPFADTSEVRVLQWHANVGNYLAEGDLLVELETDKVIIEVRSSHSGYLRKIFRGEGDWTSIGTVLALFSDNSDEFLQEEGDTISLLPVDFEMV